MAGRSYEPEVVVEDITKLTEKEWKEYRYQGIGGSDVAAVFGISPWKTARDMRKRCLARTRNPKMTAG